MCLRSVAITYLYNGVYASSFLNFETLNWYFQVLKAHLICTIKFVIQRLGGGGEHTSAKDATYEGGRGYPPPENFENYSPEMPFPAI